MKKNKEDLGTIIGKYPRWLRGEKMYVLYINTLCVICINNIYLRTCIIYMENIMDAWYIIKLLAKVITSERGKTRGEGERESLSNKFIHSSFLFL